MALLDRTAGARTVVLDRGSGLDDMVTGTNPTITGTPAYIDPIVSGTATAAFLSSDSVSIPITPLNGHLETTISSYLHFPDATGVLARFDGPGIATTNFIQYNSAGYITITLPYVSLPQVNINYVPIDTTQIAVSMSNASWAVYINGYQYETGIGSRFEEVDTLIYGGLADVTLGAVIVHNTMLPLKDVQLEMLEAVSANSTAKMAYDLEHMAWTDGQQVFANKFDVPRSYEWSLFGTEGLGVKQGLYGLDLRIIERYDESSKAFIIDNVHEYTSADSGQIYAYIPAYSSSATLRGALYLAARDGQPVDEHVIIFDNNAVKYVYREFTLVNGQETWVETTGSSLGTATGAVSVGFEWNQDTLSVRLNGTATVVKSNYAFSPYPMKAYFGTTHNANNYFASRAAWTTGAWQLRLARTPVTPGATTYGPHSYDTGSSAAMPVYAQASVKIVVPHTDQLIRKPYFEIDGKHTITEALET
jgi:hypothetical protein